MGAATCMHIEHDAWTFPNEVEPFIRQVINVTGQLRLRQT